MNAICKVNGTDPREALIWDPQSALEHTKLSNPTSAVMWSLKPNAWCHGSETIYRLSLVYKNQSIEIDRISDHPIASQQSPLSYIQTFCKLPQSVSGTTMQIVIVTHLQVQFTALPELAKLGIETVNVGINTGSVLLGMLEKAVATGKPVLVLCESDKVNYVKELIATMRLAATYNARSAKK